MQRIIHKKTQKKCWPDFASQLLTSVPSRWFFKGKPLGQMNLQHWKCRYSNTAEGVQHRTVALFTAQDSEKQSCGKMISQTGGVGPREFFLDICVLEAHLQQGEAVVVQCIHGVSIHSSCWYSYQELKTGKIQQREKKKWNSEHFCQLNPLSTDLPPSLSKPYPTKSSPPEVITPSVFSDYVLWFFQVGHSWVSSGAVEQEKVGKGEAVKELLESHF